MSKRPVLDPALIRRMFVYRDGRLWWAIKPCCKVNAGAEAGGFNRDGTRWVITFDSHKYPRTHIVWAWHFGAWPPLDKVVHLDGDTLNDRVENLRPVPMGGHRFPTKNYLAGARQRASGKWQAFINLPSGQQHLGTFDTQREAHDAYLFAIECRERAAILPGAVNKFGERASKRSPAPSYFFANGKTPVEFRGAGE